MDPYRLIWETDAIEVDLGAERSLAAERQGELIAVEIKSFLGDSPLTDFHQALGQYHSYLIALREIDPDRKLYLAVTEDVHDEVFQRPLVRLILNELPISLLIIDLLAEEVLRWIP